jgi:HEPN domain-containing protein
MDNMEESLFSRDYFGKRGSWSGSLVTTRRPPGLKRGSVDSYLFPGLLDEDSTTTSSKGSVVSDEPSLLSKICEVPEIPPDFLEMCRSQEGSRYWQEMLPQMPHSEFRKILTYYLPYLPCMMTDKYGNYMCQVLFRCASPPERLEILSALKSSLIEIAKNSRGTHSLQSLINMVSLDDEEEILEKAFRRNIVELSRHSFATHVIQKMLSCLHNKYFIIAPIVEHILEVSSDKLGLCVVKLCITHANTPLLRYLIKDALVKHALELIQDSFGNYAIQHMLTEWGPNEDISEKIKGKLAQLSVQKFSSNVVERCLEKADSETFKEMLDELCQKECITVLLNCVFGSYVIKTAYTCSNQEQKSRIKEALNNVLAASQHKKLLRKWEELIRVLT